MTSRNLSAWAPAIAFAALGALFFAGSLRPVHQTGVGYLDRPLPQFDQPPLAGTEPGLSSGDLYGKTTLVNVFASWCGACRAEHPMLMRLADEAGVEIYGLNWKDRPGAGKVFLERFGNPYRGTGDDSSGSIGARLGVTGVPETYLVDAQGHIRYRHIGPLDDEIWDRVIEPLIAQLEIQQ